jgi:ABC-type oligopeptide transport system substrate-binding subunit
MRCFTFIFISIFLIQCSDKPALSEKKQLPVVTDSIVPVWAVYLVFNTHKGPMKQKDLRKAVAFSIDYTYFTDTLKLRPDVKAVAIKGIIPPEYADYDSRASRVFERDSAKAKEALRKSNLQKPFPELQFLIPTSGVSSADPYQTINIAIKKNLGINVQGMIMSELSIEQETAQGNFDLCIRTEKNDSANPYFFIESLIERKQLDTSGQTEMKKLLDEIKQASPGKEKYKKLERCEEYLLENCILVPLFYYKGNKKIRF